MKRALLATFAFFVFIAGANVNAAHRSSPEEAKSFFDRAVALVVEVGPDQAAVSFNDAKGDFVRGDLYVFALTNDGLYLANGGFPQLAGEPIEGVQNAAGEPIYEIIKAAVNNESHSGVAEYEWLNPQTNQLESKFAYVREVEGIVVGVGYYQ